ncbi:MAG: sarcosine oxidase subunit delta [Rhodobiaceae bacterium]|nr:sarcosine oxidase subunit delta [Rhodobiaceae bacterium]
MLLIPCPYCGERPETEFSYGGEAHVARPQNPSALSDAEWAGYLFLRENRMGAFRERWIHTHGCRRWFNMLRDTTSHEIHAVYKVGDPKPPAPGEKPAAAAAGKSAAKQPAARKPAAKKPSTRASKGAAK